MIEPVVIDIELPAGVAGAEPVTFDVRCFVVVRGERLVLVDCGPPGNSARISAAITVLGGDWSDVHDVILTHGHFDHAGGLEEVLGLASQATVRIGADDRSLVRMPVGRRIEPLREGDDVLGLTVLETPGHTAGHISILDEPASVIFIGDLAGSTDGGAVHGPPAFTADREQSDRSLQRIADLEIARVLFSHGPELADPNGGMRRLLDGDPR